MQLRLHDFTILSEWIGNLIEIEEFERIVLQSIEDGLSILGGDGKSIIIWWWETKRNMRKKDIPSHIEEFVGLLEEIFGTGAKIIENNLSKEVKRAFHLDYENISSLSEIVNLAKRNSTRE